METSCNRTRENNLSVHRTEIGRDDCNLRGMFHLKLSTALITSFSKGKGNNRHELISLERTRTKTVKVMTRFAGAR